MVHAAVGVYFNSPAKLHHKIEQLRAENEKLREALIGLYKPVFENPVEVGSNLDLALRAAAAAIRESGE